MKRRALLLPLIIVLVFAALSLSLIASCAIPSSGTGSIFGDRIGLLYVEGIITTASPGDSLFFTGGTSSDHIVEVVNQAIEDKGIKALVVRINSPGGSAAASQEIYNAFKEFSDTGRPVIVSMGDVAASGGYYIAAPADEIFANPATLTGSIGVIMQFLNYEGLLEWANLREETITSGEYKDIGSPSRPMTDEEREMLQEMLDQVHEQFKSAVADGRGFDKDKIAEVSEGMIYSGEQAYENGLVDELGGLQDAIDRAADLTGLGDNPVIDELGEVGLIDQLLEDLGAVKHSSGGIAGQVAEVLNPLHAAENPLFRLWSFVLLDPRLAGDNAGIRF